MLAYQGNENLKQACLIQIAAMRQTPSSKGRWKAMRDFVHATAVFEPEVLGFSTPLVMLKIQIFDTLGVEAEQLIKWQESFLEAIRVGADLSKVGGQFAAWILDDPQDGMIKLVGTEAARQAITSRADLYRGACTDTAKWDESNRICVAAAVPSKRYRKGPSQFAFGAECDWGDFAALSRTAAAMAGDSAFECNLEADDEACLVGNACDAANVRQAEKLLELLAAA